MAEFFWHELYQGLEPIVETFFAIFRDAKPGEDKSLKPLRQAYNVLKTAQQIADFEDDTTAVEAYANLTAKEQALAKEVLKFYGDRKAFIILEVKDTMYEQSAWILIDRDLLDDLDLRGRRGEA